MASSSQKTLNSMNVMEQLPQTTMSGTHLIPMQIAKTDSNQTKTPRSNRSPGSKNQASGSKFQANFKSLTKLDIIQGILNKPSKNRTEGDLEKLVPYIKTIEFFTERDVKDNDFSDIVACLTYEFIEGGKEVFEYGTMGDKFYIIIQGTVSVMIPNPDIKDFKKRYEEIIKKRNQPEPPINHNPLLKGGVGAKQKHSENFVIPNISKLELVKNKSTFPTIKANSFLLNERQKTQKFASDDSQAKPVQVQAQQIQQQSLFAIQDTELLEISDVEDVKEDDDKEENGNGDAANGEADDNDDEQSQDSFQLKASKVKKQQLLLKKTQLLRKSTLQKDEPPPLFVEFTQLKSGKSFGELALIKNKARAATIKCIEDCHFAVMSKVDYEKVLQKIELKKINKIIEFLHHLPFFKVWTKSSLSKLQYSFEEKVYIRNQVVYREGDESSFVFIIKQGEFEITKKFKKEETTSKQREIDVTKFLGQNNNTESIQKMQEAIQDGSDGFDVGSGVIKSSSKGGGGGSIRVSNVPQIQLASRQRNTETFKILLLGAGQIFGEDDVVHERPYTTTVICRSNQGLVFSMKSQEFFRKLKANEECWKIILQQVLNKDNQMRARMQKIDHVFHKDTVNQSNPNNSTTKNDTSSDKYHHQSQSNSPQKQKYPSILQKYNIKVTQERIDDFRETLKEIVKKQRREESLGSLESPDQGNNRSTMIVTNVSLSPPGKTQGRATFLQRQETVSNEIGSQSINDSPFQPNKNQNRQQQQTPDLQQTNSIIKIQDQQYQPKMLTTYKANYFASLINTTSSQQNLMPKGNPSQTLNNRSLLDLQQRLMTSQHLRTSQQKSRDQNLGLSSLERLQEKKKLIVKHRSREHNSTGSKTSMKFNSTYDGFSTYMSVAHTLKPNQYQEIKNMKQIYQIAPHLILKNINMRNMQQIRAQSNNSDARQFMGKRLQSKNNANLNQTMYNTSSMGVNLEDLRHKQYTPEPGAYQRGQIMEQSSHKSIYGIGKFTNEQINQHRIAKFNHSQQEDSSDNNSSSIGNIQNIQLKQQLNKTSFL